MEKTWCVSSKLGVNTMVIKMDGSHLHLVIEGFHNSMEKTAVALTHSFSDTSHLVDNSQMCAFSIK